MASQLGGLNLKEGPAAPKIKAGKQSCCGNTAKCRLTEELGKAEASWEESSKCTRRTAGVRGQAVEERLAERTLGKAEGLTATGEDGDSEGKQRDREELGLTQESGRAMRGRKCWPKERSTLLLTR